MKFSIDADVLESALATASHATASRSTIPALACTRLSADADTLTLEANDGEIGLTLALDNISVDAPGVVLANSKLLAILKETSGLVVMASSGSAFAVETPTAHYDLPTESPDSFPSVDDPAGEPTLEVDAALIATALGRTTFAAAHDEGKYAMRGVLWDVSDKGLTLAATDGKRLAVTDVTVTAGGKFSALVPPKAMQVLTNLCRQGGTVRVWLPRANGLAYFHVGTARLSSRLVEGRFPPYRDVIPKKFNARVPLQPDTFAAAVRQAALMTDDESKRITFAFEAGKVTLAAQGATTGRADVRLPLSEFEGPAVKISFDPAYLLEFLRAVGDEPVTLELVDGEKSAVFRGDGFLHLVVPLV